ncbi:uncharacterized protein LOC133181404 [Saccostrea echinata]|uniref:uncharacterized protein LOC133181404 n=1 Tax=Saccostrea echinata TaxID=191078 RepID=UPI002A828419|nr:uncharacterized protein LOC133181404 [Saccostrea echinata]
MVTVSFTLFMASFVQKSYSLPVESCPMFGCRPSGTFSYDLDITVNVSLSWPKPFKQSSSADSLGCVGNEELIVCQSDGQSHRGYISLTVQNGSLAWSDKVLYRPTLPIMDIYGDIVGTDGNKLVKYEVDGTLEKPVINEENLSPVYSITFSDNNIFAIVSKLGMLVTVESNGVPHAFIEFRGWEERMNGTFIPIAPPVVSGHRIYILTAFRPDGKKTALSMQRLYAIDIFNVLSGKLKIAWYFNFERLSSPTSKVNRNVYKAASVEPQILVNTDTNMLYVNLPPLPETTNAIHVVWGFKDDLESSTPTLLFKTPQSVAGLAMYESSRSIHVNNSTPHQYGPWMHLQMFRHGGSAKELHEIDASLWAVSTDKRLILKLSSTTGSVLAQIKLKDLFNMTIRVTSRVMVARSTSINPRRDNLIFGIEVTPSLDGEVSKSFKDLCNSHAVNPGLKYYVISLRDSFVNWIIGTPNDCPAIGQIAGIKRSGRNKADMLVITTYSSEQSEIFALNT